MKIGDTKEKKVRRGEGGSQKGKNGGIDHDDNEEEEDMMMW